MFYTITKYKVDSNKLCKFLDFSLYLYSNFVYFRINLGDKLFPRGLYFLKINLHTKKAWRYHGTSVVPCSHAFHFVFYGDAPLTKRISFK